MENFGTFLCNILDRIFWILPQTPESYRLASLATGLGIAFPLIGEKIFYDLMQDISTILSLVIGYKLIKIIPAKF